MKYLTDVNFTEEDRENMSDSDIGEEFERWIENPEEVKISRNEKDPEVTIE